MDEKIKETKRQAYFFALNPEKRFHGNISVIKYCQRYVSRLRSRANHRKRVSSYCKHPHKNFALFPNMLSTQLKCLRKLNHSLKLSLPTHKK